MSAVTEGCRAAWRRWCQGIIDKGADAVTDSVYWSATANSAASEEMFVAGFEAALAATEGQSELLDAMLTDKRADAATRRMFAEQKHGLLVALRNVREGLIE